MKTTLACLTLLAMGAITAVSLAQPPEGGPPDGPPPGHEDGPHRRPPGPQDGPPPPPPLMKALDADGDHTISAEEIAGASEALKKLDKNDDGKLTAEEVRPPHPPRPPRGPDGGRDERRGRGPGARDEFGPPPGGPRGDGPADEGPREVRRFHREGPDGPRGEGRGPGRPGGPDEFGPPPHGPGGGPPRMPPHLRDALDLTDDQEQQIEALHKETREKFEKILTAEQREKLKELGPPRPPRED